MNAFQSSPNLPYLLLSVDDLEVLNQLAGILHRNLSMKP